MIHAVLLVAVVIVTGGVAVDGLATRERRDVAAVERMMAVATTAVNIHIISRHGTRRLVASVAAVHPFTTICHADASSIVHTIMMILAALARTGRTRAAASVLVPKEGPPLMRHDRGLLLALPFLARFLVPSMSKC